MAGSTTNIGLIKPTYSEDADVAIINENMDTLDSTISALDNGLAIVSNNNTHGAITAGQYVYVRNHGSLAEGMYTANSNIAANAALSSSNLTAVTGGGLNDLAGDISALNSKLTDPTKIYLTDVISGVSVINNDTYQIGKLLISNVRFTTTANISANENLFKLPKPKNSGGLASSSAIVKTILEEASDRTSYNATILGTGFVYGGNAISSGKTLIFHACYITE